jgi:3-methyladenine DNA glycosylase AlkD
VGSELIRFHRGALSSLNDALLAELAAGLDSWDSVDAFGRTLSGPAWSRALASDALIEGWARSPDRWLRRAALVSTIELRDESKVLAICATLAADRDDMVEKALSWALRELGKRRPDAVRAFLATHEDALGARVRREVGNKLSTGLKNPRPAGQSHPI